jgi:ER membrane protein complex subunit 4
MAAPPPPPQWVLDLNSTSPGKTRNGTFPDPPGFTSSSSLSQSGKNTKGGKTVTPRAKPSPEEMETLKLKKAWEVAIAPAKQLPMNAIGMYMSGNSLQMFSIMMVFMLFKAPIQALMNINQTFVRFETEGKRQELLMVKAAFVGCNLLALALGTWKVNQMGLLP